MPFRKRSSSSSATPSSAADIETEEQRYRRIDFALLRRMLQTMRPVWRRYAVGIALGVVMVVLDMQGPMFLRHLIDVTSLATAPRPLVSSAAAIHSVVLTVLLWGAFIVMVSLLQRWGIWIMAGTGEGVQFRIRRELFAKLQQLSMSYYDKNKLGRIISRCTSDVSAMREVNVWGVHAIILNVLMVVVAAGMLLVTDWRLFLAVAWLAPVLFFSNRIYLEKAGLHWQTVREGFTRVSTNLAENITGVRVVTAFNRQDPNLVTFNRLQITNTMNNVAAARLNGIYQPLLQLIQFIGRVVILGFGGYLVVTGRLAGKTGAAGGVGAVIAALLYWDWFMNPMVQLGTWYNNWMMAMASAERVYALLDSSPDVQDAPDARPLPPIVGRVEFENVVFGYDAGRPVLHGVSFTTEPGKTLALVGATGSGKSSIISLIARFYQPQLGRVLVDGHDIRHITGDSLHLQMGLVLQVNYLFTGTVLDNIRYARPTATEEEIVAAAKAIGSHEAIIRLKDGYHTDVGERGANMSLGQRQLICFTRAFLADPRIFMLDEATSAVDTATEALVQASLEKLLKGRTTFIVAHRLSTIMKADQILVIDAGKIVERGTHRELLTAGGKYATLYEQFAQHAA